MPRLPTLLTSDEFSRTELDALRLDGQLFLLEDCGVPIDVPSTPSLRAAVLLSVLPPRVIAEQRSAAWAWGALPTLPSRHQGCVDTVARTRPSLGLTIDVRQVMFERGDVNVIAGLSLTSPRRTAIDLARCSTRWNDDDRTTVAELMRIGTFSAADCIAILDRRNNLSNKRRAIARLRQVSPS